MAGCEGDGNPTPSEQDYNEDKYEENIMEQAQENDDTEADEPAQDNNINPEREAEGAQDLPESEDNDNYLNLEREAEGAQGLPEPEEGNDLNPEREAEGAQDLPESEEDNNNYLNPEREAEGAQDLPEPEEDNDNYLNPEREAEGAQDLPENEDAEVVQLAQDGADIVAHNPDAGLNVEEELGGVIVAVLYYSNGQIEFLVVSINSTPAPPEL